MPSLGHSLGSKNSRNIERRQERARQVIHRLPVELAGCILGLRKQRLALEALLSLAQASGDFDGASRVSDSLAKIAETLNRLNRDNEGKAKSKKAAVDYSFVDCALVDEPLCEMLPEPDQFEPLRG